VCAPASGPSPRGCEGRGPRLAVAIRLEPAGPVRARLRVPGDKSISHRALILNALARGRAAVRNLAPGADVAATVDALAALGVRLEHENGGGAARTVRVTGGGRWCSDASLDARNSGTTARLLLGVLAPRADGAVVLTGDASLARRPMARVVDPLRRMGAEIAEHGAPGRLPLAVTGRQLVGRAHRLPVASAQVKSALLLAGLAADGATTIEEPGPSRDHTERMLAAMGARIGAGGAPAADALPGSAALRLDPGPLQAIDVEVPGDLSSAAPFLALAAAREGSEIEIEGVGLNPTRAGFLAVLRRMGALVETELDAAEPEPQGSVRVTGAPLAGTEIGAGEVPALVDELPLLALLATQAHGVTRVTGAKELRVKESDRIAAIVKGLRRMGASIEPLDDGFVVEGPTPLDGAVFDAAGDHRIAMALAIAALLARGPSELEGEEWVAISFPRFFEELEAAARGPAVRGRA